MQKPHQFFQKKKSPKFSPQKKQKNLDLYEWNAIKRGKTRSYLWREEQYRSKNEWGRGLEWEKWVGGGEESEPIERDRKKKRENCTKALYRKSRFSMDREVLRFKSRQMELSRSYREVSTTKWPRWIEKLLSIYRAFRNFLDGSRSCWVAIETNSQNLRWIKIAITSVEKGRSRGSIDSLAIEGYREAVEIAQKQFFKEEKNTNMNAIKHATQPKI